VNGIENLVSKSFDIIYECMEFMVGKWCDII